MIILSFSSWNDSPLEEDSLPSGSVILLLALLDEPSGEDLVLHSCRLELFLTSELEENVVPLLDCLHDIILIVCGRHLKLPDSAKLSISLLESGTLYTLQHIQRRCWVKQQNISRDHENTNHIFKKGTKQVTVLASF